MMMTSSMLTPSNDQQMQCKQQRTARTHYNYAFSSLDVDATAIASTHTITLTLTQCILFDATSTKTRIHN